MTPRCLDGRIARLGLAAGRRRRSPARSRRPICGPVGDHFGAPPRPRRLTDENDRPILDMGGVLTTEPGPGRGPWDPLFVTDDGGILDNIPICGRSTP